MSELAALSSMALTLGLVLARPRVGTRFRVGPATAAAAGVLVMLAVGLVGLDDVVAAARELWRPLVTIASIMVLAAAAHRLGILDRLALGTGRASGGSTPRLFALVFALSAVTSGALNNDAAVLLLTPLVVVLVRAVYPDDPGMVPPFAFAVFMAAGVAPLVVSNPMNMIVAEFANIGFNAYALQMIPISVAGWVIAFGVLWVIFRSRLRASPPTGRLPEMGSWGSVQWLALGLVVVVLAGYPIVSYLGGPIWVVAGGGATLALVICATSREGVGGVIRRDVSWETLLFFVGALVLAIGLRNAGLVDGLTDLYEGSGLLLIGSTSAVGSALINNHPMALINLLAIDGIDGATQDAYLAAVIGGDLGPRLLPIGSLAGLLWFASLRRLGVEIPVWRFVVVGGAVTVPTLAASLILLEIL